MHKRTFIRTMLVAGVVASGSRAAMAADALKSASSKQADYLFFVNDKEKTAAKEAAASIVAQLDTALGDGAALVRIYDNASPTLKSRYSAGEFAKRMVIARASKGKLVERALEGLDGGFKKLPNMPEGEYLIVIFDSVFQSSDDIYTEQISLVRHDRSASDWQLAEYYSDKKPFYSY